MASVHAVAYAALLALSLLLFRNHGAVMPSAGIAWAWTIALAVAVVSLVEGTVSWRLTARFLWRGWRAVAGVAVVGLLAWIAGQQSARIWDMLAQVTLGSAGSLLQQVEKEIVYVPEQRLLGTPSFTIEVAPICSGAEGIGLTLVLTSVFLVAARKELRFPMALALIPIGALLSWAANVLRIWALIEVGTRWSPTVALGGFHSKAGWFLFGAVTVGLCLVAVRIPLISRRVSNAGATTRNPTATYLSPLLALLAVGLATGTFATTFDAWYGLRVLVVGGVLLAIARRFRPLRISFDWSSVGIGVVAYLLWIALVRPPDSAVTHAWLGALDSLSPSSRIAWIALRAIGAVIIVPLAEELAFRGYLLPRLIRADFTAVPATQLTLKSLAISSLLFGLMHEHWIAATLAGALYAWTRSRRGRLADAVVAHATTNLLIAVSVLTLGHWHLWM